MTFPDSEYSTPFDELNFNERGWWEEASRESLVRFLEGERCIACYDEESTGLLRECAAEDYPAYMEEQGEVPSPEGGEA